MKRTQIEHLDPATPVYECPECFRLRPSRDELAVHLRSVHNFPEWYAGKTANHVQARLPHEIEVRP